MVVSKNKLETIFGIKWMKEHTGVVTCYGKYFSLFQIDDIQLVHMEPIMPTSLIAWK